MAVVGEIVPDMEDVAALIAVRTIDVDTGAEANIFTSRTRPTAAQAQGLADVAARDVFLAIGVETLPDELADDARQLAAIRTAALIQLSYYVDGSEASTSATTLATMYQNGVAALQERLHWTPVRL